LLVSIVSFRAKYEGCTRPDLSVVRVVHKPVVDGVRFLENIGVFDDAFDIDRREIVFQVFDLQRHQWLFKVDYKVRSNLRSQNNGRSCSQLKRHEWCRERVCRSRKYERSRRTTRALMTGANKAVATLLSPDIYSRFSAALAGCIEAGDHEPLAAGSLCRHRWHARCHQC
jgi:hypothetical protein